MPLLFAYFFRFKNIKMIHLLQTQNMINWKLFFLGGENFNFLWETILRTLLMFTIIVISLRILGKRGVKQLSIFELIVIISLGSAAGDPMLYKDVGVLPAILIFVIVISLYSILTSLISKSKKFEILLEGKPVCLIKNGIFLVDDFSKEALGEDEFFAELRMQSVSQLGQIKEAIVESSGNVSIFFYADDEVRYGLSIMPNSLNQAVSNIHTKGHYACIFCGYSQMLEPVYNHICKTCKKNKWVKAVNNKRVN